MCVAFAHALNMGLYLNYQPPPPPLSRVSNAAGVPLSVPDDVNLSWLVSHSHFLPHTHPVLFLSYRLFLVSFLLSPALLCSSFTLAHHLPPWNFITNITKHALVHVCKIFRRKWVGEEAKGISQMRFLLISQLFLLCIKESKFCLQQSKFFTHISLPETKLAGCKIFILS